MRLEAKITFVVSLISQLALLVGSSIGWLRFGAAPLPLVQGLAAMTILAAIEDRLFWHEIQRPVPLGGRGYVTSMLWRPSLVIR